MRTVTIDSTEPKGVIDVTDAIEHAIPRTGYCLVHVLLQHTSAVLFLSADDHELRRDLLKVADLWLAPQRPFEHVQKGNPNAEAHVLSAFGGVQLTVPARDGALQLGTYQRVLLIELDGPGERQLLVTTVRTA